MRTRTLYFVHLPSVPIVTSIVLRGVFLTSEVSVLKNVRCFNWSLAPFCDLPLTSAYVLIACWLTVGVNGTGFSLKAPFVSTHREAGVHNGAVSLKRSGGVKVSVYVTVGRV